MFDLATPSPVALTCFGIPYLAGEGGYSDSVVLPNSILQPVASTLCKAASHIVLYSAVKNVNHNYDVLLQRYMRHITPFYLFY